MATFSKAPRFPEQPHGSGISRTRGSKTPPVVNQSDYSPILPRHLHAGQTPFKLEARHTPLFEREGHGNEDHLKVVYKTFWNRWTNGSEGIESLQGLGFGVKRAS